MGEIMNLVGESRKRWAPMGDKVPTALRMPYKLFKQCHAFWRRFRRIEIYSNPDNFLQIAGGRLLNATVGELEVVRFAAQLLMISTRILECVEEEFHLGLYSRGIPRSFDASTLIAPRVKWLKKPRIWILSPYLDFKIRFLVMRVIAYLIRIFLALARVFLSLYRMSMKTMDTVESFSVSPVTRNQGVNDFFLNSTKWLDKLAENKQKILEGMRYHRHIIEDLLDRLHSPIKFDFLESKLITILDLADAGNNALKSVSKTTGEVCRDLMKEGVFGFFAGIGLAKYTPDMFVPHPLPSWDRVRIDVKKQAGVAARVLLTQASKQHLCSLVKREVLVDIDPDAV